MIKINDVVFNKQGERGIIKSIITKSTGYVLVSYDCGKEKKEMAFNMMDENGKFLRKAPKTYKEKPLSPLQDLIANIKYVNGIIYGDRNNLGYKLWLEGLYNVKTVAEKVGNQFIIDVCNSADRYMHVSDKQAYCIARFAFDNGINKIF